MKYLFMLFSLLTLTACNEKEMTVYDYLQDQPKLKSVLDDCISGRERDEHKCEVVKTAYGSVDSFNKGLISEERLKELGKQ